MPSAPLPERHLGRSLRGVKPPDGMMESSSREQTGTFRIANTRPSFHLVPDKGWHPYLQRLDCDVNNNLDWEGSQPLPRPPSQDRTCWLIPTTDTMAVTLARHRIALRGLGWKLLSCDDTLVATLGDKVRLHALAVRARLLAHMPVHYSSLESALFPCLLKGAHGCHGTHVHLVRSKEEVRRLVGDKFDATQWLLCELVVGVVEHSTTLLVNDGEILDVIRTTYEFDREVRADA